MKDEPSYVCPFRKSSPYCDLEIEAEVRDWLAANPRIHVHFSTTSGSWLNLAEVWFGIIEPQVIHRGTFRSVQDLNAKIRAFIDGWNDRCHPFVWTKTADEILKKANRQTTFKHEPLAGSEDSLEPGPCRPGQSPLRFSSVADHHDQPCPENVDCGRDAYLSQGDSEQLIIGKRAWQRSANGGWESMAVDFGSVCHAVANRQRVIGAFDSRLRVKFIDGERVVLVGAVSPYDGGEQMEGEVTFASGLPRSEIHRRVDGATVSSTEILQFGPQPQIPAGPAP